MRDIKFEPNSFKDYLTWYETDEKIFEKINELLIEIAREPTKGRGKPEPLKHTKVSNIWSRRITQEHRLIYKVEHSVITIISCVGHYD